MEEVKFYREEKNYYRSYSSPLPIDDWGIYFIYELVQDFAIEREVLIERLASLEDEGIHGEIIFVDLNGSRASIGSHFDEEENLFELDRTHLIELERKWDNLSQNNIQEIVIRRDGERFEIEEVHL